MPYGYRGKGMTNTMQHVVCPHCSAVNRVPVERLTQHPNCGRCHEPLFEGRPLTLSSGNFDAQLVRSDVPVLVDFWATWCGPCQAMAPVFERAASVLEPRVRLAKLETEASPEIAARYGIRSIPTLVLFLRGQERARISGAMGFNALLDWTRRQLDALG